MQKSILLVLGLIVTLASCNIFQEEDINGRLLSVTFVATEFSDDDQTMKLSIRVRNIQPDRRYASRFAFHPLFDQDRHFVFSLTSRVDLQPNEEIIQVHTIRASDSASAARVISLYREHGKPRTFVVFFVAG
jgi:hypothetical protein